MGSLQTQWFAFNINSALYHRYGGRRIANCAETALKCCSAEHSGQKLFPVVVRRLSDQIDIARVVTESEKHRFHMPKILLVVMWGS